jgi:predicted O-linked N-acetylglucosamine transferase (SPINDLY family)
VEAVCAAGAIHFSAGKLEEAYARFSFALELRPNHVPALQALGLLYQTRGMLPEAARAYAAAIASHEEQSSALARSRDGASGGTRLDENENETAGSVAATRARLAATLSDIGTQVKLEGDVAKAMTRYREAIATDPSYAPARYNLGVALHELGQSADAEARYSEAAALDPSHADALCNLGVMRKLRGDVAGAVAAYEACLSVNPNHAHGTSNMAIALNDLANAAKLAGDVPAAIRVYERALTFDSGSAESMYNLGVAQAEVGELDRAVIAYETTLKLRPGCAEAWNNLGVLLRERGNAPRAAECYANAVALKPGFAQACNNLGVLRTTQGKAQEALTALQSAVAADPEYAVAHNNLGVLLRDTGDVHEALRSYEECVRLSPDDRVASQNYLLALNYVFPGEDPRVCDAHVAWGRRMAELVGEPLPPRAFDEARDAGAGELAGAGEPARELANVSGFASLSASPTSSRENLLTLTQSSSGVTRRSRRLVVGYVSPDMYTHSVSYFAAAPLRHHDAARVRLIVYSATPVEDARTHALRASVAQNGGEWRDVARLSERALAELIRRDGVDVLVELTGHTANNRLATLALRPAPVQVTWMGYPNSTGMAGAVAYRVTDERCDPTDTKQTFAERSVRLPGCFLCYTPHPEAPPVARAPCLAAGYVTFGCFNALAKVTPAVRALWGRLLRAVPHSRLVVKAKPFACASVQRRFLSAMAEEGVASWRVDVRALAERTADHLGAYGAVDVALDTFPYAGTTTTCEALWQGVPVVTMRGAAHAHNVGVSLLAAVGLERECVAETPDAYVAKCAALAADRAALAAAREGMRAKMRAPGGLCDGEAHTRKLEEAYVAMWRRHCEESARSVKGGSG